MTGATNERNKGKKMRANHTGGLQTAFAGAGGLQTAFAAALRRPRVGNLIGMGLQPCVQAGCKPLLLLYKRTTPGRAFQQDTCDSNFGSLCLCPLVPIAATMGSAPANVREICRARRADGPAAILAIGTANPANCVLQDEFPDFYFGATKSEHLTGLKDKFTRVCKHATGSLPFTL